MPMTKPQAIAAAERTMQQRVLEHAWHTTPLGPRDSWPATLRVAVEMVLASRFPQCLVWGPQLITIHNDAFGTLLGDKPDALGRSFSDVWSESWDSIAPIAERAFQGEATFIEDFPLQVMRRGYPEQAYFTFCYSPVRDEQGVVLGMLDTVVETTEKVIIERRLLERQQYQEELNLSLERRVTQRTQERDSIWQNSRDLLATIDEEGLLRTLSPSWQRSLAHPVAELVGRAFLQLVHADDLDATRRHLCQLPESGGAHFENRCAHADGSWRWISWYLTIEHGITYAYGRDISEEKEQALALAQAEEQLRQAQKMDAVGQLTGGLAHDFNNLLAGIIGNLELLDSRLNKGRIEGLERYTSAALGAANRAASLTHRLLAFSRRQTLAPKPTNVNRLIHELEELLQRTVGPHIRIEFSATADPWIVLVDPNQLENAVLNLCINARDAMPDSGLLCIGTRNLSLDHEQARVYGLAPGEYLSLHVRDNGSGMPPHVIERAFDPFFTTKPTGKGTGLGLSMIYGFARQSGGMVRIESTLGSGTLVQLCLPRNHRQEDTPCAPAKPEENPRAAPGKTILVIDDEATLRQLVSEVLQELGYNTLQAADGPSGLRIIQSGVPIDLLISDVGLPGGMNGRQVADAARQLRPALKVLFITGYAENAVMDAGDLDAGMQVLTKPFEIDALASQVTQLAG